MIKHLRNGKFQLYTKDGSRALGPPTTRKKAIEQEVAIKIAQAKRRKDAADEPADGYLDPEAPDSPA